MYSDLVSISSFLAICQPGSYSLVPQGTVPCLTCPLNTYQPYEGQSECLRCPENHITQAEGAKDSNQCIFGKYNKHFAHYMLN